jgi:paraquat-inducible protein B
MNRLVTSPEITNGLAAIRPTLDQYRELGAKLTSKVDPLADSVTNSLDSYRLLGEKLNRQVDPLANSVTNTLAEADRALVQIRGAAENLRVLIGPDAPLPNDLAQALQQLSGAVQSLASLLDFLKQHPNALITGRETLKGKP